MSATGNQAVAWYREMSAVDGTASALWRAAALQATPPGAAHELMLITTLPRACPDSTYRIASGTCSSG